MGPKESKRMKLSELVERDQGSCGDVASSEAESRLN